MFGRRKREEEAAAKEAERRALFAELAKRPDTVCPFLGMAASRTDYLPKVNDEHRCYAFGDPAELSAEQQQKVCLQRGYGNCPRYLRGVLVIPTEELEALRRPQPAAPPPPPPAPAVERGGGRRALLALIVVLFLALGAGAGAYLFFLGDFDGVASDTLSPSPSTGPSAPPPSEGASLAPSPSVGGTPSPTPLPTPVVLPSASPGESVPPLPTPGPGDVSTGHIVVVNAGQYPVVRMEEDGTILEETVATFDGLSGAPVERIVLDDGIYWRTLVGDYTGLAYSRTIDDEFDIYETYETSDGEARFRLLEESEL